MIASIFCRILRDLNARCNAQRFGCAVKLPSTETAMKQRRSRISLSFSFHINSQSFAIPEFNFRAADRSF